MTVVRVVVMGAGRGVGASMTAAAVVDTLSTFGVATTLLSVAPPYAIPDLAATSGLDGAALAGSTVSDVGFRIGRRASGAAVVALGSSNPRKDTRPGFFSRGEVPQPKEWLAVAGEVAVLVVDLGWDVLDGVEVADEPVTAWLRDPQAPVYPLVAAAASRPGMVRLGQVLAALRQLRVQQEPTTAPGCGLAESMVVVPQTRAHTQQRLQELLPLAGPQAAALVAQHRRVAYLPESEALRESGIPQMFTEHEINAARDVLYGCGAITPPKKAS